MKQINLIEVPDWVNTGWKLALWLSISFLKGKRIKSEIFYGNKSNG